MAAGGFRTFVAGEVLDEDDINNYLMQGILVFGGTAERGTAIGTAVEGQFAFLTDSDTLTFYDGSQWAEYETGLIPAQVSATTGSPGTGTFTDSNGVDWDYYTFTGNGSITIDSAGYADCLIVGGGGGSVDIGGGYTRYAGGGAGAVRRGAIYLTATTHTITVGAGGSANSGNTAGGDGGTSSLGSFSAGGGGAGEALTEAVRNGVGHGGGAGGRFEAGANGQAYGGGAGSGRNGLSLNYTGSAVEYGKGGSYDALVANTGSGGRFSSGQFAGTAGVVIVKVLA